MVYERYNDYTKERACEDYKESKHKGKYEEILKIRKETFDVCCEIIVKVTTMTSHSMFFYSR